jgi:hypothetical protein
MILFVIDIRFFIVGRMFYFERQRLIRKDFSESIVLRRIIKHSQFRMKAMLHHGRRRGNEARIKSEGPRLASGLEK